MKRKFILLQFVLILLILSCKEKINENSSLTSLLVLLQSQQEPSRPCQTRTAIDQVGVYNATQIVSAPADTGTGFLDSRCAIDGVLGMGNFNGSLDVFTLDINGPGATIILGWNGKKVLDTIGNDFIVYENPFLMGGNPNTVFLEPTIVEVGNDQANWCGWNPTYTGGATFSNNPNGWLRFAGIRYVDYNQDTSSMNSATLFSTGGGDVFDLSDANFGTSGTGCNGALLADIQANGFLFVKLTSAKEILTALPISNTYGNPDIDGVIAKQLSP
ncbi:LIC_13355 family lipoprotein [Leptospira sp. WS92.C1]